MAANVEPSVFCKNAWKRRSLCAHGEKYHSEHIALTRGISSQLRLLLKIFKRASLIIMLTHDYNVRMYD